MVLKNVGVTGNVGVSVGVRIQIGSGIGFRVFDWVGRWLIWKELRFMLGWGFRLGVSWSRNKFGLVFRLKSVLTLEAEVVQKRQPPFIEYISGPLKLSSALRRNPRAIFIPLPIPLQNLYFTSTSSSTSWIFFTSYSTFDSSFWIFLVPLPLLSKCLLSLPLPLAKSSYIMTLTK